MSRVKISAISTSLKLNSARENKPNRSSREVRRLIMLDSTPGSPLSSSELTRKNQNENSLGEKRNTRLTRSFRNPLKWTLIPIRQHMSN